MKDLVRAALGAADRRLLVIEPPGALMVELCRRPETELALIAARRRGRARRALTALRGTAPPDPPIVAALRLSATAWPLLDVTFDAVIFAVGLPCDLPPIVALHRAVDLLRPAGAVLVVSPIHEGPVGKVRSVSRRVARGAALPRATDLTAWMLRSGLRSVRQANLPKALTPSVFTWARLRPVLSSCD